MLNNKLCSCYLKYATKLILNEQTVLLESIHSWAYISLTVLLGRLIR